jgi:hypothetical protein
MLLTKLQGALEALYRIEAPAPVSDFAIGRRDLLEALGPESSGEDRREVLLVRHEGESTALGLYVAEEVVHSTERFFSGAFSNLDQACVAIEGVSHFVYFTYVSAAHERPVSQIELELQAEVDKYLLLRLCAPLPRLLEVLFERFELASHVSPHEGERYCVANERARRYARWLERKIRAGDAAEALDDARRLYRKPFAEKLDHIAAVRAPLARAA